MIELQAYTNKDKKKQRLRDHEHRSQLDDKSKEKATQTKHEEKSTMNSSSLTSIPVKLQQMPQSHRIREGKQREKRKQSKVLYTKEKQWHIDPEVRLLDACVALELWKEKRKEPIEEARDKKKWQR